MREAQIGNDFESDLGIDVKGSLSLCARLSGELEGNPSDWKWCLVAVHSSLQSTLTEILAGSDGAGAYKEESAKRWRSWLSDFVAGMGLPHRRLAELKQLYRWAKDTGRMYGHPIGWNDEQDMGIDRLSDYRDNLVHHEQTSWVIPKSSMAHWILIALDVVEQLLRHPRLMNQVEFNEAIRTGVLAQHIDKIRHDLLNWASADEIQ